MTQPEPPQVPPQVQYEFTLAEQRISSGVYANFLGVWHTPHEFTLDFAVTQPPSMVQGPDGEPITRVPCEIVARVRVPPTVLFDFLRSINENLTNYEAAFGPVQRPSVGD